MSASVWYLTNMSRLMECIHMNRNCRQVFIQSSKLSATSGHVWIRDRLWNSTEMKCVSKIFCCSVVERLPDLHRICCKPDVSNGNNKWPDAVKTRGYICITSKDQSTIFFEFSATFRGPHECCYEKSVGGWLMLETTKLRALLSLDSSLIRI